MHSIIDFPTPSARLAKFLLALGVSLITATAMAISTDLKIRDNDEQGNYELDYIQFCSDKCDLQESTDFGATWTKLERWYSGTPYSNYVVADKPDGTYKYRIKDWEYDWEDQEIIIEYSDVKEVIVGPVSLPPTLEEQLDYEYETRLGDLDSDGLKEIFLNRLTPAPANNGTIKSVILKQTSAGVFETIVPNTPQLNTASSWPVAAIDVLLADANLDGFADVRLDGVGNVISGVYDQLVYSPAVAYTDVARNVKAIDPSFEAFANDLMSYYTDDDYFTDRQTQVYVQGEWEAELDCELEWRGIFGWEWICNVEYVWEPGGWITDYPGVTDGAVSIWEQAVAAEAGQGSWDGAIATLASQFGVDIQVGGWCVRVGNFMSSQCANAGFGEVMYTLFILLKHSSSPALRAPNTIYLTARRALAIGPYHTALEYTPPIPGITKVVSAVPVNGKLKSDIDLADDIGNITFDTVSSTLHPSAPALHFAEILAADAIYNDCLIYKAIPGLPGEYNSNGYIAGLLIATAGQLDNLIMADFKGGERPVPTANFTSSMPCP